MNKSVSFSSKYCNIKPVCHPTYGFPGGYVKRDPYPGKCPVNPYNNYESDDINKWAPIVTNGQGLRGDNFPSITNFQNKRELNSECISLTIYNDFHA
jgi:hypothetical protein